VQLLADGIQHHDLSANGWISTELLGLRADERAEVRGVARVLATYTLRFLDATLCDSTESRDFLTREPEETELAGEAFELRRE